MRALPGKEQREPPGKRPIARADVDAEPRERILRVLAELVAKRGYSDTPTDLVVRRAKVGYGTFCKFFPDKEAAFLAMYDETFEAGSARIAEAFGGSGDDRPWGDRVAAAIAAFYAMIASDPLLWKACLVESLTAGPKVLARSEESIEQLGLILRLGRRESQDAELLPQSLESTLAGGIVWIAYQRLILGEAAEKLPGFLPEAVQFSLSPYLGEEEAIKVAQRHADLALESAY